MIAYQNIADVNVYTQVVTLEPTVTTLIWHACDH